MIAIPTIRLGAGPRRWLAAACIALAMTVIATAFAWPVVVRHLVVSRLGGITHRTVRVDTVQVNPFTGRVAVTGLQLFEGDDEALFAAVERFDARVRPLALLGGHLSITDAVLEGPTVRVVRHADHVNVSDLFDRSDTSGVGLEVTVDRFVVTRGTVTLEDRALREPRTWRSEGIEIEARNLSTLRDDGHVVARSVTAGAPASLELTKVRLRPIHLEAVAKTTGLDLGLARLYFPPDAAIVLERGRASSTLELVFDAREGIRATATGELADVVLVRPGEREPAAVLPKTALRLSELVYREDALSIGLLELTGSASVRDPSAGRGGRYQVSTLRASIADVTWPVTAPGQLDVESSVPGGGMVRLTGALRPPPASSQLRLLATSVDLAPWANLVPVKARITGVANADLRVDEPLAPGVPNRVRGSVAVSRIGVADGRRELAGAERAELSDLEVRWPSRLSARRLVVQGPRATIERTAAGELPLRALFAPADPAASPAAASASTGAQAAPAQPSSPQSPSLALAIGEVVVKDGRLVWRDEAVTPRAALDFTGIDVTVTGSGWPLGRPLGIKAAARPVGGGQVLIAGRVGIEPISADVRLTVMDAEIAPYQPYVPLPARIAGRTDLDVAVKLPSWPAEKATVQGRAAVSRLDVRDGERSVLRAERVSASSLDVDWPRRLRVGELAMRRPWVLIERARDGILPLRVLLSPRIAVTEDVRAPSLTAGSSPSPGTTPGGVPVTVARLVIEDGGARVVDQRVAPPFALDMQRLEAQVEGASTDPAAKPAQLELKGRVGGTSILALSGTIGSFGGPLRVDVNGDLRGFAIPRTNSYLVQQVAWEAREGWLTTAIRCRIDGDALDARSEIQVSRLQLARAGAGDEAQARIGLPLGMLVALMKDGRGDIRVTLPVRGRLSDPRFDFSEAIWSTIRNVAVKAIAAPVSWIGRVQFSADSRIERIDVDPIPFASGQATLTPGAREQLARVAAFLEQMPDVRMALTPIVSSRDRAAMAEANGSAVPDLPALAARRLEAVRDGIKKAGVDAGRLTEVAASPEPIEGDGQVKLDLIEPENLGSPIRPNLLKRLLGEAGSGTPAARN